MHRYLARFSTGALLAVAASAQCFEPIFGTQLLSNQDDAISALVPMNISFPMGGAFANYDSVVVNSNGCAFLWNGAGPAVGTTATGYGTAATMVTNIRGAAGGGPRIAPYWRDLDTVDVFVNTSLPGKTVITWANCTDWSAGGTAFTMQAQLFPSGEVHFFYDNLITQLSTAPIAGISQGGGVADPGLTDLSTATGGVSVLPIVYETFATLGTFDLANQAVMFLPNGGGGYDTVPLPYGNCLHASHDNVGVGCYQRRDSLYQHWTTAAAASAALQGNAMILNLAGAGYSASWIPGGSALYVPPTIGATSLAVDDDGDTVVTPSIPLTIPGGTSAQLTISHNGIITAGATGNNSFDYEPAGASVALATGLAFYSWTDFRDNNTTPVASGTIKTEEVGGIYYVTWDNVDHWASPQVTCPSTIQFQIDLASGMVTMVWVTVDTNSTSTFGSAWLVGVTGAGAGADLGSFDFAANGSGTSGPDVAGLGLSASPIPVINPSTLVTYTATGIPEFVPTSGVYLSTMFLSVAPLPGGFNLTGILMGTPGCSAYIASLDVDLGAQLTFAPTATWNFTFDNIVFAPGNVIGAQAVALFDGNFPLFNGETGGFVVSNGVISTTQPF